MRKLLFRAIILAIFITDALVRWAAWYDAKMDKSETITMTESGAE